MTLEPRTIDERYSAATHSSDLGVRATRCDVDYLIAAGWIGDGLGTRLYRLASEWDLASGDYRLARHHLREVELQAFRVRRNAQKLADEEVAEALILAAEAALDEARRGEETARHLAWNHLKTLKWAREALYGWAIDHADRTNFHGPNMVVRTLADGALELWLDPTCQDCHGTRWLGGFGKTQSLCPRCHGSGKAHHGLSKTERHAAFMRSVLAVMDLKTHRVEQAMARWLRHHGVSSAMAPPELRRRLVELRSTEAEQD